MIGHGRFYRSHFFELVREENLRTTKLPPEDFVNDLRRNEDVGFLLFKRIEQFFPATSP
jgi:hypothetical protein